MARVGLRAIGDFIATGAMVVTAGVVLWSATDRRREPPPRQRSAALIIPSKPLSLDGSYTRGNPSAAVVILEFGDLQCPACARFANETFRGIVSTYVDSGRVLFAFRNFPLPNHPRARPAAIAAQCAGRQGKFWSFYEDLYLDSSKLEDLGLRQEASHIGLDLTAWSECLSSSESASVAQAFEEAKALNLPGTPTFFIGRKTDTGLLQVVTTIYGAKPLSEFETAVAKAEVAPETSKH